MIATRPLLPSSAGSGSERRFELLELLVHRDAQGLEGAGGDVDLLRAMPAGHRGLDRRGPPRASSWARASLSARAMAREKRSSPKR